MCVCHLDCVLCCWFVGVLCMCVEVCHVLSGSSYCSRFPPPQYLVLLLAVLCLYDIMAVFITPYFTKVGGKEGRGRGRRGVGGWKGEVFGE